MNHSTDAPITHLRQAPAHMVELSAADLRGVHAVMSMPRLAHTANLFCAMAASTALGIPVSRESGAFWGQCLERRLCALCDRGDVELILTIDYDSVFTVGDVARLIALARRYRDIHAIVPVQVGRDRDGVLATLAAESTTPTADASRQQYAADGLLSIRTGHFGLSVLRVSALRELPHPWFWGQPDARGCWGLGRIDDDIHFWRQFERAGLRAVLASDVWIGHAQQVITWPGSDGPIHQYQADYEANGRPAHVAGAVSGKSSSTGGPAS